MAKSPNVVREPRRFSGTALIDARLEAGMSRTELAAAIGKGADAVRHYETGRAVPPGDALAALAYVLHIEIDALYAPAVASA